MFSRRDGFLLLERRGPNTSISSGGDLNGDRFPDVLVTEELGETAIFGVEPFTVPSSFGVNALGGGTVDYDIDFPDGAGNQNYMVLMSTFPPGQLSFLSGRELALAAITFPTGGLVDFSSTAIRLSIR